MIIYWLLFFITASCEGMIYGALLYNLGLVLDCVDGNMARTTGKTSPLGWFLDTLGADFFYGVFFIPIGIGVALSSSYSNLIDEPVWFVKGTKNCFPGTGISIMGCGPAIDVGYLPREGM